jgi:hypothetical protein
LAKADTAFQAHPLVNQLNLAQGHGSPAKALAAALADSPALADASLALP